jgi:hypothetical protein
MICLVEFGILFKSFFPQVNLLVFLSPAFVERIIEDVERIIEDGCRHSVVDDGQSTVFRNTILY